MKDCLTVPDRKLCDRLLEAGVPLRRAVQLQNLCTHCGYCRIAVDAVADDFIILTPRFGFAETESFVSRAAAVGTTLAILAPYDSRERERLCRGIVTRHCSTTVDNRGYLLVFNNNLPKQHFRI